MFKSSVLASAVTVCFSPGLLTAATFSFEGFGAFTLTTDNNPGSVLADNSIVQVGYFLGVDSAKSPAEYTSADWNTFTALTGPGSPNTRIDVRTSSGGSFTSVYFIGSQTLDDSSGDTLPSFPSRFGVRIFDTTDPANIATANFNTVSAPLDRWLGNGPDVNPPVPPPNFGYSDNINENTDVVWQGNDYEISINPIPEASTTLSILLASLAFTGRRRRA